MGLWQTVAMQKIRKFPISVDMQQSSTVTCGKSSSSEWALGRCWATIVYFLATCFERFRSTKTLLFRTWDGISIVHTSFHLHFLSLFLSLSGSLSHSPTVCYLLPSMFHLTIFRDETGRRCLKVYLLYYLFVFILSSSTTHQTCFRVPQRLANYGKIILCLPLHHWPLVIWVVDLGSIQFKFMDL